MRGELGPGSALRVVRDDSEFVTGCCWHCHIAIPSPPRVLFTRRTIIKFASHPRQIPCQACGRPRKAQRSQRLQGMRGFEVRNCRVCLALCVCVARTNPPHGGAHVGTSARPLWAISDDVGDCCGALGRGCSGLGEVRDGGATVPAHSYPSRLDCLSQRNRIPHRSQASRRSRRAVSDDCRRAGLVGLGSMGAASAIERSA